MRINDDDFEVALPTLDDLETDAMSFELSKMLGGCPSVKDAAKRATMSHMYIALIELCQCISHVLRVQYSLMAPKIGLTQETTLRLVPKQSATDPAEVLRCDKILEDWHENTSADLLFFQPGTLERTTINDGEVINLHRALLTGVYTCAISALHRPQVLPSSPTVVIDSEIQEISRRKVREAANDVTEVYKDLYMHDMIRYLPNTGVSIILPALIIHMLDLKSEDSGVRQASARKFQCCMQALQRLREMYSSADFAFSILDASVRKANVQIPNTGLPAKPSSYTDQTIAQNSPDMLTPPPEVTWTANQLLFASTLAPEEKKLLAAFGPARDVSLNTLTEGTSGAGRHSEMSSSELDDNWSSDEEEQARLLEQQAAEDFEALIDLEGHGDVEDDKGIYAEMNMAWLNGMEMNEAHDRHDNDDNDDDSSPSDSYASEHQVGKDHELGGYVDRSELEMNTEMDENGIRKSAARFAIAV